MSSRASRDHLSSLGRRHDERQAEAETAIGARVGLVALAPLGEGPLDLVGQLGVPVALGYSFGLLAFTTFVYDTLDVCTRLGRYVLQEMTGLKGLAGGAAATLITLAGPSLYLGMNPPGKFYTFWTIFGTSNQLLAALTLVGVMVGTCALAFSLAALVSAVTVLRKH